MNRIILKFLVVIIITGSLSCSDSGLLHSFLHLCWVTACQDQSAPSASWAGLDTFRGVPGSVLQGSPALPCLIIVVPNPSRKNTAFGNVPASGTCRPTSAFTQQHQRLLRIHIDDSNLYGPPSPLRSYLPLLAEQHPTRTLTQHPLAHHTTRPLLPHQSMARHGLAAPRPPRAARSLPTPQGPPKIH